MPNRSALAARLPRLFGQACESSVGEGLITGGLLNGYGGRNVAILAVPGLAVDRQGFAIAIASAFGLYSSVVCGRVIPRRRRLEEYPLAGRLR